MSGDCSVIPRRILVFRIGQLGDTIAALPAFWALKAAFPSASLSLLTNCAAGGSRTVSAIEVIPPTGLFDEVIDYRAEQRGISAVVSRLLLAAKLRKGKFDRAYYLMPRNRTLSQISRDQTFFRLAGINEVLGIKYLKQNLLAFPIPLPTPEVMPESDFLVDLLRSEGVEPESNEKALLDLSNEERRYAAEWLSGKGLTTENHTIIAVGPGSNWRSKVWAEARFELVVSRLIDEFNVWPIVVGGRQDREVGSRLIDKWKRGLNAAGEVTVRQSASLLEHCHIFLGNDTGTMHLAAAVGTPCVAVFAAVDWIGKWTPFGSHNNRLFRSHVDCEGCHLRDCPYGNKCLELISVDDVHAACAELLRSGHRTGNPKPVHHLRVHA
jgi:heptosyltransferase III